MGPVTQRPLSSPWPLLPAVAPGQALGAGIPGRTKSNRIPSPKKSFLAKHSGSRFQITIENGTKPFTSLRRARKVCARGLAEWTGPCSIRFRNPEEVVLERARQAAVKSESDYSRMIAAQRGGTDLSFLWSSGYVRATPGQPDWMPVKLGYKVRQARVIPTISEEPCADK